MTHFGSGGDFRLSHLMITLHAKDGGWWPNLLSWWGYKMMSAWSGGTERIRRSITGLIPAVRRIRELSMEISAVHINWSHPSYTISPSSSCCLFNSLSAFSSFMQLFLCDLPPSHHRLFLTDSPASPQGDSGPSDDTQSRIIICCNQHLLYFIHLSCVFLSKVINEATCPQKA